MLALMKIGEKTHVIGLSCLERANAESFIAVQSSFFIILL